MRKTIKGLLGQGLAALRLDHWLLGEGAVIVTFHRVQPSDGRDSLTMPVEEFEQYCSYFRERFDVVGLREIVRRLESRQPLSCSLAITFDDGYADNFEYAAPVLERYRLPATFFVVSDWMGTQTVAWWDRARHQAQSWMTWDQVRDLQARGFEIGAHTRTHIDLGAAREPEAREEIAGSRRRLEEELGAKVQSFAYPYGLRDNISRGAQYLVREAGFTCCCASYGGVNRPGSDPFHLMRIPVIPEGVSPHQFAFDVALGRTLREPATEETLLRRDVGVGSTRLLPGQG